MAFKYHKTIGSRWILILLAFLNTISQSCVEGLRAEDKTSLSPKPKGTLKTIKVLEHDDVIDCVDIYKQPAFGNPLIKELKAQKSNQKVRPTRTLERKTSLDTILHPHQFQGQMVPNSIVSAFNKTTYPRPKLIQTWNKYGSCPEGTIPIKRTWNNGTFHRKGQDDPNTREYATVLHYANRVQSRKVHAGSAIFNVWKPRVASLNEFSLSQMWAVAGPARTQNTVEAGWTVYPGLFHDALPRLFIYWTSDNYNKHGCYNLLCPGFVQTSKDIALGSAWDVTSIYGGPQVGQYIGFIRGKDTEGGDWWLRVGEYILGYYPRTLFPRHLGDGADFIAFGGEIVNSRLNPHHTTTTMGSGRFSAEGRNKACFISDIKVKNDDFKWVEPHLEIQTITRPTCYNLAFGPPETDFGSHFYFGGPGYSQHCT